MWPYQKSWENLQMNVLICMILHKLLTKLKQFALDSAVAVIILSVCCVIAFPNLTQTTSSNNVMPCERTRGFLFLQCLQRGSFLEWITALHLELLFIGMQVHLQPLFRSRIVWKWGFYCPVDDKKACREFLMCAQYILVFFCLRQRELFYRLSSV